MTISKHHPEAVAPFVSEKMTQIRMSAIKKMSILSAQVEGAASLAWGLPSFRTPEYIRNDVVEQLARDADIGKYSLPDGLRELRQLALRQHAQRTGVKVDADHNVLISAGNLQGLNTLLHVIVDPGSEIILTDPGFASHIEQIKLCGGTPVFWPLDEQRGWQLNLDRLPELINARTKAIILVSPSNPTGKIFSENELTRMGEIATRHGLLILLDDPYCHFTYENRDKYYNLAANQALAENIVYFFSFSKSYAMSGWRLGYIILPASLKQEVLKVHDLTMICTPRISQVAGIAALSHTPHHLPEFENTLAKRRELICQRLDAIPHVFEYIKPEGAYYVFPRIVADHRDDYEFALRVLNEAKVTLTPGSAFGPGGVSHVRMAYCVAEDTINLAFDRLERYFGKT